MRWWLGKVLSSTLAALCLVTVAMWARSHRGDQLRTWTREQINADDCRIESVCICSDRGQLFIAWDQTRRCWRSPPRDDDVYVARADHDFILRMELLTSRLRPLMPAPSVAWWQRAGFDFTHTSDAPPNGHRAYGSAAVPYWAVVVLLGALPTMSVSCSLVRLRRRQRAPRVGCCRSCGYDLRATPDCCPECGDAVTSHTA